MSDKMKNIISNFLGVLLFGYSIYALVYRELEVSRFLILAATGLVLFLFKISKTKEWLSKYLDGILK